MDEIARLLGGLEPREAARAIARAASGVFPLLDAEERRDIITNMLGDPDGDKVAGLVHL